MSDEQQDVLFRKATEAPFSGTLLHNRAAGSYQCANCGTELFKSDDKYESGISSLAGWPSFAAAARSGAVKLLEDNSHDMRRTEVVCGSCGGHLGHIFPDGSSPTGEHYCINSAALEFTRA
ncbi:MAG TPA: peptide-methionine (R)-S-oxide reductase MsrB [Candidatus Saccharimonadales bacterium]